MNYQIYSWTLQQLITLYEQGNLNLNPPYQRNPVWTKKAQISLIETIKEGAPIPNFFLYEKGNGLYEMVDGQQRTRTVLLYQATNELDIGNDSLFKQDVFPNYTIAVIIIQQVDEEGFIEDFYYKVNSSGVKINRPETLKARYLNTTFYSVVEQITSSLPFQSLDIFPASSQKRMMDRDLVEELCALIIYGITDKKIQVDKIYERDVNEEERQLILNISNQILKILSIFSEIKPIRQTRYKQRNDFYTLFGFIKNNIELDIEVMKSLYHILVVLGPAIRPSKFAAKPLAEYAFNCITQSNSARARLARLEIINSLLLVTSDEPSPNQVDVSEFYNIPSPQYSQIAQYKTFNISNTQIAINNYLEDEE